MWTKEDQARVRTLHTKQMTVKEIAEEMGKPQGVVRAALEDMGYKPIETKEKPESEFLKSFKPVDISKKKTKITSELEAKACELREQKFNMYQIADKLHISQPTVSRILKKHGFSGKNLDTKPETKEDKPMKAAQINEEFDKAVDEMIADAKEKEPAPSANDASSKGVIDVKNETSSQPYDTTEPQKSQALTAIAGISMIESMLHEWLGAEADITYLHAERQIGEIRFLHEGREYAFTFGEVPSYGNDKH